MINISQIESVLIEVRNNKVILDSDIAKLYGVETKRVNEAVKNNPDKFPDGYIIELNNQEWSLLKSKFSTSIKGGKTKLPKAFTEKGLYMLATVLKSPKATQTTISIIETYAKIKELSRTITEISNADTEQLQKQLMQKGGDIIGEILDDNLSKDETETTIEINFAVLKLKHTIKRK